MEDVSNFDFSPIVFSDKAKEKVQRVAFQKWADSSFRGTLEISTGSGKTFIGLMAIKYLRDTNSSMSIVIVVPKKDLMQMWINEIKTHLPYLSSEIGRIGDGHNEDDKKIRVCIVNSIRDRYLYTNLIICDEFHKYGSIENLKFLEKSEFKHILGLSATMERSDNKHHELYKYAPHIFSYSQKEAIEDKVLCPYDLVNVSVRLDQDEYREHARLCTSIAELFREFNYDFKAVQSTIRKGGEEGERAANLMALFGQRRTMLLHNTSKINRAIDIVHTEGKKCIVFCEYIKTAEDIAKGLKVPSAIYHSKMKSKGKEEMLEGFRSGKYQVMISVKSLDEGTNIPDCEMAIIVGGSKVHRQTIQRLGRILRTSEGKESAKIYQLYIPDSKDESWLSDRMEVLSENAREVKWSM